MALAVFKMKNYQTDLRVFRQDTEAIAVRNTVRLSGKSEKKGTINGPDQTASFTNTKDGQIDTGISLDSLPYILVFAGVAVAAVVMVVFRKRRYDD